MDLVVWNEVDWLVDCCFQLRCALCNQGVHIVVNELPLNFAVQNVIDELLLSNEGLCQVCHEDRKLEVATSRCLDCCKTLCFLCADQHAKEHNVKSLSVEKCDKHHERDVISKVPEGLAEIAKTEQARKTADTEQPGLGEGVVIIPPQLHGNYQRPMCSAYFRNANYFPHLSETHENSSYSIAHYCCRFVCFSIKQCNILNSLLRKMQIQM